MALAQPLDLTSYQRPDLEPFGRARPFYSPAEPG